ncbi:MAG: transposase, partial [Bacteroidetes bacterium]
PEVKLTLKDRTYSCDSCGFTADRDENAALNVLAVGLGCSLRSPSTA